MGEGLIGTGFHTSHAPEVYPPVGNAPRHARPVVSLVLLVEPLGAHIHAHLGQGVVIDEQLHPIHQRAVLHAQSSRRVPVPLIRAIFGLHALLVGLVHEGVVGAFGHALAFGVGQSAVDEVVVRTFLDTAAIGVQGVCVHCTVL